MAKIAFMGAGSTIFVRAIMGDCMLTPALRDSEMALYDIDAQRLEDSQRVLQNLNDNINEGRARITTHLGVENRKAALQEADFVVDAVQIGGYEPSTVIDFEIPRKYGLRQTIADTLGIGGIMRAMRTIPVIMDFAQDMEEVCPEAWFLNYTNPMAMITGALLQGSTIRGVGLCHSVQGCMPSLIRRLGLDEQYPPEEVQWEIAGINHMAWLLSLTHKGRDIYPEVKDRAREMMARVVAAGGAKKVEDDARKDAEGTDEKYWKRPLVRVARDMVRLEIMLQFGYYVTESSEHNAEYMPYWIKDKYPELIDRYGIPLDEYPRRCVNQIKGWQKQREELLAGGKVTREKRGHEYGSYIMESIVTGQPTRIHGSVMNWGSITNLPATACVEVACLVDRNGVQPTVVGDLPEQCAALNRTNYNVQQLTIEAALEGRREALYHAAFLDPHTSAELSLDDIRKMVDELIEAHGDMMPTLT